LKARKKSILPPALLGALALLLGGCFPDAGAGSAPEDPDPGYSDGDWSPARPVPPKGWPALAWPKDNPYSSAKAVLGRRLFFETALSRDRSVSCASCHEPSRAFSDAGNAFSAGVHGLRTHRNAPSLTNAGFGGAFLFEGGVPTLELQALAPLFAGNEMDMTGAEIEARLAADTLYVRLFRQAYGEGPITLAGATKALATYQRTLVSFGSPYDRWRAGDGNALSPAAKRGEALFTGEKGDCWHCHAPPLFTNGDFHNLGIDSVLTDLGRALVTGKTSDEGKFKTPSLRNVAVTSPYLHDGRLSTLTEVVEHYNAGQGRHPNTDALMRPLGLSPQEVSDLVAFLEALTDSGFLAQPRPGVP
jgi:cytochrome c peroxidase